VPNFWRIPTDNDEGNKMPVRQGYWRQAGPTREIRAVTAQSLNSKVVRVTVSAVLLGGSPITTVYTIYGSGDVVVELDFQPDGNLPELPRFGMQMALAPEFDQMEWYGRGPQETYWDRQTGAAVGVYAGSVAEHFHHYVRPQETGNKTDVRWLALTNKDGVGLLAVGAPLLYVSAWPYSMAQIEAATHTNSLDTMPKWPWGERSPGITVNLDYKQMGVGGDNSWGARAHPQYTLPARPYSYRFRLTPLTGNGQVPGQLSKGDFE
jgi:beta-galactosidase